VTLLIHESVHWKKPLLAAANWLDLLRIRKRNEERSFVRIERELFVGFYAIRKLLDTFKISPSTRTIAFSLIYSPCIKLVDYLNSHRIDELFNLKVIHTESRDLEFLCNQFIHSYVFIPALHEDGRLAGIYITSDRSRQQKLYFVELTQILIAFRAVGSDYPVSQHMQRNEKTSQWEEIEVVKAVGADYG